MWKVVVSMIAGAGIFAFGAFASAANVDLSHCTPKKFKVTAYYSPLLYQEFYYRWNHKDEVILNGEGTHGASGKPVFHGMLAGPESYAFGTKISFPGRWVGEIADRGGAIVEQWERSNASYDRIDVWVGKGEEGLKRALSFGVQYLDAYVCPEDTYREDELWLNYDKIPVYEDFFHASLRVMSLWPDRRGPWVEALQDYLIVMWYMGKGRNTGYYGRETKAAVCKYQQDRLGMSWKEEYCGMFWPHTRYNMRYRLIDLGFSDLVWPQWSASLSAEEGIVAVENQHAPVVEHLSEKEVKISHAGEIVVEIPATLDERIVHHMFTTGEFKHYQFLEAMKKWDTGKAVRILERKLAYLGYLPYDRPARWIYNNEIIQAVYQFQLDHDVLRGDEDMSVWGYLGARTRAKINSL